ncbi:MAG: xanthine dehydrogenase small subunit [Bacteroidetes bacterium]|nr:xanthine dehydrogenase small subunit [Bacteroidota bacterium]
MKIFNKISFILGDEPIEIDFSKSELKPTTTVLNFLRSYPNFKGVKEGCGEGDCGACTIVLAELNENNKLHYYAVDSCLVFLPMIHGKQVLTVEHLAQKNGKETILHPVQKAIIENDATQCGYCTPGFAMSMFALYKNKFNPTKEIVIDSLAGNLCRCTGYKPLINAAIEACSNKTSDQFQIAENKTVLQLQKISEVQLPIIIEKNQQFFAKVFSLSDALKLKKLNPEAIFIGGATDTALRVTKKHEVIPSIIDISSIQNIKYFREEENYFVIGSGISLEDLKNKTENYLPAVHHILKVFGSKQIRNLATLGGNLGSASPIGDTLPMLIAHEAVIIVKSLQATRRIPINSFIKSYRKTAIQNSEIITEISVPIPDKESIIKSYKVSKRKDLDISTVSACFNLKFSKNKTVEKIILAFGGMAATPVKANSAEAYLIGKKWELENIKIAMELISKEFEPISDARASKEFRIISSKNLLLKFFNDLKMGEI